MMPFVSVLVNTYNYARYVEEAVESALQQDYPSDRREVIVVDDGSTDDTPERMIKWGRQIRYIRKENCGQASAYNVGFDLSRGEIICFLDADDYWHRQKLSAVVRAFTSSNRTAVLFHPLEVVDAHGVLRGYTPTEELLHGNNVTLQAQEYLRMVSRYASPSSGICVRASCLRPIMPVPEELRIAADSYLHLFLPLSVDTITVLSEPLGVYRVHGNSHWITSPQAGSLTLHTVERLLSVRRTLRSSLERKQFQNAPLLPHVRFAVESEIGTLELIHHSLRRERWVALKKAIQQPVNRPDSSLIELFINRCALIFLALLPFNVFRRVKTLFRFLVPSG